ncbi:MAG TPA: hypothetical protein VMO26_12275 [Vicinamibacterales bacterium]|nr:hypothetical protein [Vicinamibacterales bacterium]
MCIFAPADTGASAVAPRPVVAAEARAFITSIGPGAFPAAFAFTEAGLACLVAGVEELPTLEPFHDGGFVLLAQAVESGQQLFGIMRAESGGLVVDQDGPVRMARGHSDQFYAQRGIGTGQAGDRPSILNGWN